MSDNDTPARSVYVASIEGRSGKSLAALGLMELASRRVECLGFFRPVVRDDEQPDPDIELMRRRYGIPGEPGELRAFSYAEAQRLTDEGRDDELLQRILERYERLAARCDFVVCEGTDYTGVTAPFEFEFNARIAALLDCAVFFVANGRSKAPAQLLDSVAMGRRAFEREGLSIVGTLINRVQPDQADAVRQQCRAEWPHEDPVWVVPEDDGLGKPTVADVSHALGGRLVHGEGSRLHGVARDFVIADMQLAGVLERLEPGSLVLTAGDRPDIVLGCLMAQHSDGAPNIAGIVLTGGTEPPTAVVRLVEGLRRPDVPVIGVDADSYECAVAIEGLGAAIGAQDERKIASALGLFETHVDLAAVEERVRVTRSTRVTPLRFEYELIERARASRRHIVLPEGADERMLRAAEILLRRGVADLTLLGDPTVIRELQATLGIDLEGAAIEDPATSDWRDEFAKAYHELRQHKGVNEEMAHDTMGDVSYFGTMMVHTGRADGMVSGATHPTTHTIRPALEFIRTREGVSVVSSVFLMCLEDRVLVYGDCAVNPRPDAEQLADIAVSAADTATAFGIEPRVAMLSYSTGESGAGEDVDKVREATRIARSRRPDLPLEGPIQYDAAVDASVARQKLPESKVAGRATVFVFPDLNTGNNTYKAVQRSAGAVAIGPVLQGLRKPVNDLSRGCTVPDIVNTVAVTAIQAGEADSTP
ncbi:MAG: phosphate acetyltransferase [Myxococcota bacterium]|nr:phosphate acetyltransferase [Myxococcota bacterium]